MQNPHYRTSTGGAGERSSALPFLGIAVALVAGVVLVAVALGASPATAVLVLALVLLAAGVAFVAGAVGGLAFVAVLDGDAADTVLELVRELVGLERVEPTTTIDLEFYTAEDLAELDRIRAARARVAATERAIDPLEAERHAARGGQS